MNIEIFTQPKLSNGKDYSLGEKIRTQLASKKPKFTKATLFFGLVKSNAFDELFEDIKNFIINGGSLTFYLSQPQKSNIKKIVNSLLGLGCEVFLFKTKSKDIISDFQYKGAIFESSKKANLMLSTGNFTMSGLFDGYNTVTQISYDLDKDKEAFSQMKESMFSDYVTSMFYYVDRSNFDELFSEELPTIEEFTHKDIEQSSPIITEINDINIDIEIDKNVDFVEYVAEEFKPKPAKPVSQPQEKKTLSEPIEAVEFEGTKYFGDDDALDIENMLFESSSKGSSTPVIKSEEPVIDEFSEDKIESSKIIAKSANLSRTSIFMLQLPKITKKGNFAGEIKIPSYLRDLIPTFWDWPKEYSVKKDSIEKSRICTFKIIDTTDADNVITDNNVKLFQREGENSFSILSNELINLDLQENDIVRFIKTQSKDGSYFTCEVVRKEANEYPIWEQFCTSLLKGSKRKYGMM